MNDIAVKICGIRTLDAALTAARGGAQFLGFVFFRKSPRAITAEAAEEIIMGIKEASFEEGFELPKTVGLFVDAGEKEMSEAAPFLTHFQFHGHESPERCEEMGLEFAVEVIKAIPVATADDIAVANEFAEPCDLLLFDAKPPPGASRPGGHGEAFDWRAVAEYGGETPYLLAGGLTPNNIGAAIAAQKSAAFYGVDVSSGVESAPGVKGVDLIEAFLKAARRK